jgi:hypothetical protein
VQAQVAPHRAAAGDAAAQQQRWRVQRAAGGHHRRRAHHHAHAALGLRAGGAGQHAVRHPGAARGCAYAGGAGGRGGRQASVPGRQGPAVRLPACLLNAAAAARCGCLARPPLPRVPPCPAPPGAHLPAAAPARRALRTRPPAPWRPPWPRRPATSRRCSACGRTCRGRGGAGWPGGWGRRSAAAGPGPAPSAAEARRHPSTCTARLQQQAGPAAGIQPPAAHLPRHQPPRTSFPPPPNTPNTHAHLQPSEQ